VSRVKNAVKYNLKLDGYVAATLHLCNAVTKLAKLHCDIAVTLRKRERERNKQKTVLILYRVDLLSPKLV